ncbi:MAG: MaoC family dehydratase N-terminal domain-containing protein [Rhodomicrobium sp.]
MSFDHLKEWIGRTQTESDVATEAPLIRLAATLDHTDPPWPTGQVPPLGHWLYFLPRAPESEIGPDGHAKRGGFLPPVNLPRRMWAGGQFEFLAPIPIGAVMTKRSTVANVEHKIGRSGAIIFVKVTHEISIDGSAAIREVHDIVYRELPSTAVRGDSDRHADPSSLVPEFRREIVPDPVLLFRYSALTFNGHRIHYDRSYCEKVEGYPGLVVHGPLTATLLVDLYLRQRRAAAVHSFRFRAKKPLFDTHAFTVCGAHSPGGAVLCALDDKGSLAMTAELEAL